jgi:hypothetical protein
MNYKDFFNTDAPGTDEEFRSKVLAKEQAQIITFGGDSDSSITAVSAPRRRRRFALAPIAAAAALVAAVGAAVALNALGDGENTAEVASPGHGDDATCAAATASVPCSDSQETSSTSASATAPPHDPNALLMQRFEVCPDLSHPLSFVGDRQAHVSGTTVYRAVIGEEIEFGRFTLLLESIDVGGHGGFSSWCEDEGMIKYESGTVQYNFSFPNGDGAAFRRAFQVSETLYCPNGNMEGTMTGPTDEFRAVMADFEFGFLAGDETHLRGRFGSTADTHWTHFFSLGLWTLDELVEYHCPPCAVDFTVPPVFEDGEACECRVDVLQRFNPEDIRGFVVGGRVFPISWGGEIPHFPEPRHGGIVEIDNAGNRPELIERANASDRDEEIDFEACE